MDIINESMNKSSYPSEFLEIIDRFSNDIRSIDGIGDDELNVVKHFESLVSSQTDNTTDFNSNIARADNITTIMQDISKPHLRKFGYYIMWKTISEMFSKKDADDWLTSQLKGETYFHDSTFPTIPYCWSTDAFHIAKFGLPFVKKPDIKPASHLTSYIAHLREYIWYSSNQMAGASAVPNALIPMAYYVEKDIKDEVIKYDLYTDEFENHIKQQFQVLTYGINMPNRSSVQSPFTNLSFFDREYMSSMFGSEKNPDGSYVNIDIAMYIQRLYMEWITDEFEKQILTFPVLTVMFLIDKETKEIIDKDFLALVSKLNIRFGHFNIFISSDITSLSTCCRLISDTEKINNDINKKDYIGSINGFGAGSSINVGSHRVISLNLPHLAYLSLGKSKDTNINIQDELITNLVDVVENVHKALVAHRKIIKDLIDKGSLPLYQWGFMMLDRQYSTVGIIGLYEAVEVLNKYCTIKLINKDGTYTEAGKSYVKSIINFIKILNEKAEKEYDSRFNLEQVPAEGAAVKLFKKDLLIDTVIDGKLENVANNIYEITKRHIYSNQWYPLTSSISVPDRIELSGLLDPVTDGGAILHINIGEVLTQESMKKMIEYSAKQGVIYFAINYNLNVCSNGHTFISSKSCPKCGKPVNKSYTRIVGYLTEVQTWNKIRREEDYPNRDFHNNLELG